MDRILQDFRTSRITVFSLLYFRRSSFVIRKIYNAHMYVLHTYLKEKQVLERCVKKPQ